MILASIISLEILIDDLPEITNTARLCHCMRLDKRLCDKIEQEMQGDLWKQTREIAAAWFDRHIEEPSWEEIINILVCMNKVHDAKKIADKRGIKFKKALFHPQH